MDESHLDKKYFIDNTKYNCPFCRRGSVSYSIYSWKSFDWSYSRTVYIYFIKCNSCQKISAHYSNYNFTSGVNVNFSWPPSDKEDNEVENFEVTDLDSYFFYHQPTSFFTINTLIPETVRELMSEADGCLNMNFLVGASGALRKAIYEFIKEQKAEGEEYQEKIKWLKIKYPALHSSFFDALANIQDMTSENLHEKDGSWEPWNNDETEYLIEVVKAVLNEVYVKPKERQSVIDRISTLKGSRFFAKTEEAK